ncbi:MAG: rhodanese-like domain-containing protein [Sulfurovaceae bacterium]|jgi:rhodanese-related sulfurtransferase|nr:rhodanese-like domain-containing protein [Sulfurovaceae bacterium]
MKSLHTKLDEYVIRYDEASLSEHLKALVETAAKDAPQLSPEELIIDDSTILLDVREPEEFASGYIEAKNILTIPRGKLEFMAIDKIAKVYGQDVKIITYCLKGPRGALAASQLKKMGFANVSNVKGGLIAWLESGRSIKNYLGELKLVR